MYPDLLSTDNIHVHVHVLTEYKQYSCIDNIHVHVHTYTKYLLSILKLFSSIKFTVPLDHETLLITELLAQ